MKGLILSLILLYAWSGSGLEATTPSRRVRGVELIASDGSLRARIIFDRDVVLLDFPIQQRGYLFERGSYVSLNHAEREYRVYSYSNLLARINNWPQPDKSQPLDLVTGVWAGLKPTGKTEMIAGFNATEFVRTSRDTVESEMWICEVCSPAMQQTVGEEIRRLLPETYWSDDNPTMFQAVLVFGVPLRIVEHGREPGVIEAIPIEKENLHLNFLRIPPEYTQRG